MIKIIPNKILNIFSKKTAQNSSAPAMTNYQKQIKELDVFCNHIYEYKKGVRPLILTTEKDCFQKSIEQRLKKEKIDYLITPASKRTINVFFGAKECIDVVKTFGKRLNELTPEQDFMLGIMLGYEKVAQCGRYLKKQAAKLTNIDKVAG